jgi:hypothetical protein
LEYKIIWKLYYFSINYFCRYGGDIVGSVSQSEMQYEAKNYKRDRGWERGRGRGFMPKMFMIDICID